MGNCLQAAETEHVDLLTSDNETMNTTGRNTSSSATRQRNRGRNSESNAQSRPARSSRRQNRNNGNNGHGQHSQRRSSDSEVRQRPNTISSNPNEVSSMQRSENILASDPNLPVQMYHPSPGVSRSASELTEEEQIKIAQRIGLINHLPVDIYVEGRKADTECIICMGDFVEGDKVRFLPCMHTYHVTCIDDWLMRSFSCPSCLEPVDSALLTSYDQQQMTAFIDIGSGTGNGDGTGFCQSLPKQLQQLTAITSPPPSSSTIEQPMGTKQ